MAIWSDKTVWSQFFEHFCKGIVEKQKEYEEKQSSGSGLASLNTLQSGVGILKMFGQKLLQGIETPTYSQKIREDALDDLGIMMFSIKFSYEFIAETLIAIADEWDIERKFAFRILRKNEDKLTKELFDKLRDVDLDSLKVEQNAKNPFTISRIEALINSSSFLNCTETLELGLTCKDAWKLTKPFYGDKVLTLEPHINNNVRLQYWSSHILPEFRNIELRQLDIMDDDEIILLDVKRTFPQHKDFSKDVLVKVLKNIKFWMNGSICYYQGLNYLAGFILHISKNPTFTIRLTCSLLKEHLSKFVGDDLHNMKTAFYILSRLNQIFLPSVFEKLKNEKVSVDIFSASWILTVFTTVAQSDPDSRALLEIVDMFIAGGWAAFFRATMLIMNARKDDIEKMSYEDIMMIFFNINKSPVFQDSKSQRSIVNKVDPETPKLRTMSEAEEPKSAFPGGAPQGDILSESNWPEIHFKSDARRVRINKALIDFLVVESVKLHKQIENFWASYERDPNTPYVAGTTLNKV